MSENVKKTSATRPPNKDYVRAIPMGGLNEVGMNCCVIESNGSMILVDCGLTFPETSGYGVDVIFPDLSYVLDNLDILDAVVLTHGHEDHIGALAFFLREVDVPVYGGKLTLAMVRKKVEEQGLSPNEVTLHEVEPGDRLKIRDLVVEFIHVNHSIPNAMAIAVETKLGRIMFTGDWKLDHTPLEEAPTDLQRLAHFGQDGGLLALFGDSTNSGSPGYSVSEAEVKAGLASVLENAPGRVIVAQFSSNLHRVQGLLELAAEFDRVVALQGRSMISNFGLASSLGFVKVPKDVNIIDANQIGNYPDDEVLLLSTGSQAEPRAALTRIAYGAHRFSLKSTDTVVLSARVIPGNEVGIDNMINNMVKRGAKVITHRDAPIHATGHAKRGELKLMINLTRPKYLIPVHGSYAMRRRHADIGESLGIHRAMVIEDGDVLEFTSKGAQIVDRVHVGRVFVDGRNSGSGDIADVQLRDRKKLAHSGLLVVHAVLDLNSSSLVAPPELMQRGLVNNDSDDLLKEASNYAAQAVANLSKQVRSNPQEVSDALRNSLKRFFNRRLDKKPVIVPIVHTL